MSAGTLALTNNSATVTGTGTAFSTDLKPNDFIVVIVGGVTYTLAVKSIASATSLTLITAYGGPTAGGNAWTAVPNATLVGITAQVASDVAKAIRGLNLDKANWQQVYSGTGNITVTLPDGSNYSGPSWNYLATNMATKVGGAVPVNQGGTGSTTGDGACSNIGALPKSGGTMTGPLIMNGSSVISAQGGVEVNLAAGLLLKGKVQQGAGRDNNLIAISGDGSTPNTGFVNALQYNWYADGWILGVIRGSGTNTLGYSIYYNGAAYGASKLWNFNYDGSATSSGAWVNGSDERHKSNILPVDNALSAVLSWRGATYDMKDGAPGIGLVAQDVEKNCPRAVKTYGDRTFSDGTVIEDFKYLDTSGAAAAYHTEAIKQLFKLVELALDDQDACRAQIAAIKKVMSETTAEPTS